jgi:GWxTD domain-containing protein
MKKYIVSLLVIALNFGQAFSQNIDAQFDICNFQTEENTTYLETYLSINAQSVAFKSNENDKLQAKMDVFIQFINADNKIVKNDKYSVYSPEIADSTKISMFFIDQQRYSIADGKYKLSLQIRDAYDTLTNEINYQQDVEVVSKAGFSGVQLVDSYAPTTSKNILSKSGYDLTPFVSNFYNQSNDAIKFYFEYYPENKEKVLLRTSIKSHQNDKVVYDLAQSKWSNTNKKTVILSSFPINKLHSSSYRLVVEAINKDNEIVFKKERLFYKINDEVKLDDIDANFTFASLINNEDTLKRFIQYLYPIENANESFFAVNRLKNSSLDILQKYFYKFWIDRNPFSPEEAWLEYLQRVKEINSKYHTGLVEGFLTDRGRIALSHGEPNSKTEDYLPKAFQPFEVWHYYRIGNERDIKFIFTNANNPNVYRLVYSNKSGEVSDMEWQDRFENNFYNNSDDGLNSPWDTYQNPR